MEASRLEDDVAGIWRGLLGLESVSPEDDFFRLGGDSLLAVRMLAAVEETLLVPVSFVDFIDAPTVGGLAQLVEREEERPHSAEPEEGSSPDADGWAPCTFAQERLLFVAQLTAGKGV